MESTSNRVTSVQFEEIYIFGDSLSDTGNLFALSGGLFPPSPPYFNGRFSNGPLWIEGVTESLDLNPSGIVASFTNPAGAIDGINFALSGANTDDSNSNNTNPFKPAGTPPLPGLESQVDAHGNFVNFVGAAALDNALHVLWVGSNDYLGGGQTNPAITLANIGAALEELHDDGATNFLIVNLPPLGELPLGQALAPDALNALTAAHNQGLAALLAQFELDNPEVSIAEFDANAVFNEIQADPAAFGFSTTGTDFSLVELFTDPPSADEIAASDALFFDDLHPSATGHRILADAALAALKAEFVTQQPDPEQPDPEQPGPEQPGPEQPDPTPLTLYGSSDTDELLGQAGDDLLYGNNQATRLVGGDGNDQIYGGSQAEMISGGAGNDIIYGNGGADVIDSGTGLDQVWLGGSSEAIVLLSEGEGYDLIQNFQPGMTTLKGFSVSELTLEDSSDGARILKGDDLLAIAASKSKTQLSGAFVA